jgi:hypothetical protein
MADYALAEETGEAAGWDMRRRWLADFAALSADQARPVQAFVARDHAVSQVIGYNKGRSVPDAARRDRFPAFQAGIQRFWREQQFRVAAWATYEPPLKLRPSVRSMSFPTMARTHRRAASQAARRRTRQRWDG